MEGGNIRIRISGGGDEGHDGRNEREGGIERAKLWAESRSGGPVVQEPRRRRGEGELVFKEG